MEEVMAYNLRNPVADRSSRGRGATPQTGVSLAPRAEVLSDSELRARRREQRAAEKDERLAQASASGGRMRQ